MKRNNDGLYQVIHSSSDDRVHDEEWIHEERAKGLILQYMVLRFMEDVIKLDMDFPGDFVINGKIRKRTIHALEWILDNYKNGNDDAILEKARGIMNKHGMDFLKLTV